MVGQFGEVQVMDWGLAKELAEEVVDVTAGPASAPRADPDGAVTQSDQVLGTLNYMAPEQARGEARRVGRPADVFAPGRFSARS